MPFLIAELPSEEVAIQIANRSVTLKHITELWAVSTNADELHNSLRQYVESEDFSERYAALHLATFRFNVEIYCKAQSYAEKVARMEVRNEVCPPGYTLEYGPAVPRPYFSHQFPNHDRYFNIFAFSLRCRNSVIYLSEDELT